MNTTIAPPIILPIMGIAKEQILWEHLNSQQFFMFLNFKHSFKFILLF